MAIEPVKIPQNVNVEDHIIGPVTLRQLFLTLGGGGVSYALFAMMKKAGVLNLVTGILAWMPLILTAAFSFIKINELSLPRFIVLLLEKSEMPTVRYWQTRRGVHISAKSIVPKIAKQSSTAAGSQEQSDAISELSNVLDSGPILAERNGPAADAQQDGTADAPSPSSQTDAQ